MNFKLSFVIPAYNEEDNFPLFYNELLKNTLSVSKDYEIIFVDDGSTDSTLDKLKELEKKDSNVGVYSFQKNHGKAEALSYGFSKVTGDYIVTLDADLQDKPEEIKNLKKKLDEGFDCVSGWRKNRKDKTFMVIPSRIFNYLVGRLWGVRLHDYNCGLKIYTKNAAKSLDLYGGMHRFIPLLLHQKGFSVSEIPTEHQKRMFGKSKYGFSKVFKDLPDMFTMFFLNRYSNRPMHFFGLIGGLMLFMGTVFLTYLTIIWLMGESIGGRPLLFLGMLLVIAGFQLFFTGFLADLIIHSSRGSKQSDLLLKYETEK